MLHRVCEKSSCVADEGFIGLLLLMGQTRCGVFTTSDYLANSPALCQMMPRSTPESTDPYMGRWLVTQAMIEVETNRETSGRTSNLHGLSIFVYTGSKTGSPTSVPSNSKTCQAEA